MIDDIRSRLQLAAEIGAVIHRNRVLRAEHTKLVADHDVALEMIDARTASIRALLAIVDRHVGYSSQAEQEAVRAARELL